MHRLAEGAEGAEETGGRRFDDSGDRRDARAAIRFSALGLAATGLAELAVALVTGSVGLLGDSLHNLSDVSTSLVVFVGFRVSQRPATSSHPTATSGRRTWPASGWPWWCGPAPCSPAWSASTS